MLNMEITRSVQNLMCTLTFKSMYFIEVIAMKTKILRQLHGVSEEMGMYLFNFILFLIQSIEKKVRRRIIVRRVALEHFSFMVWMFKKIVLPLGFCYLLVGLFYQETVFDSLLWGIILFVYGNFFPDFDSLFIGRKNRAMKLSWHKKCLLLCFAPVCILMFTMGKWKIPLSKTPKIFHSFKSVTIYGVFLSLLGFLLYGNLIEITSPLIFGLLGYLAHLKVDKYW